LSTGCGAPTGTADAAKRLGREGKPGDTKLRRYLRRELKKLRDAFRGNDDELRRIGIMQQIFEAPLPPRATDALTDLCRLNLQGETLLLRLEALREHYRLALPGDGNSGGEPAGVLRIVCSEGLV